MSDARRPIEPTRIFPAAETMPAPAAPPPPPPVPPVAPGFADPDPDWWRPGSGPLDPRPPMPVDVHVHLTIDHGGPLIPVDPAPGIRWYQRIRIGYNLALGFLALGPAGPWAWVLASVRDSGKDGLAGAWVMALIPLVILGFLDNARQVEARCSNPDLWAPKLRAGLFRWLLWAAVIATVLTLPLTTLVYAITGVKPA
jgi:hypothetical protein